MNVNRINGNTVILTDHEREAREFFNDLLDDGYDLAIAVAETELAYQGELGQDFLDWLAQ